jgi:hypothetical protein
MTSCDPKSYDPGTVPEWARESIARIAREHPESLDWHLGQVAEIEAAKRRTAGRPLPPAEPRDLLHLAAIEAWQALASGEPAPDIDPLSLQQAIYEVFSAGNCISPVEQLCEDWYGLARSYGIRVDDEDGDLLPDVDDAITRTVTAAIWFGITTGYFALTGSYHIPRKYLAGV